MMKENFIRVAKDSYGAYLERRIDRPVFLSGGFGSEVEKYLPEGQSGIVKGSKIIAPLHVPDVVQKVHTLYANAGADILTADSFNASISRQGGNVGLVKEFAIAAEALAKKAAIESKLSPLVAMSLTSSGDCYDPYVTPGDDVLISEHAENINILKDCGNLIFAETIPTIREALIISDLAQEAKKPFAVIFSADDEGKIRDGCTMEDAVEAILSTHSYCVGLGVNCCSIQGAKAAVSDLKEAFAAHQNLENKHILAYPNGGKGDLCCSKDADNFSPKEFTRELQALVDTGATIIGGCCGTTPAHTQEYAQIRYAMA